MVQLRGQGIDWLVGKAGSDQPDQVLGTQPGPGQSQPSGERVVPLPGVEVIGGQVRPAKLVSAPMGQQAGGVRNFDHQRCLGLVEVECLGGRSEVTDAQPAIAQRRWWRFAPQIQQGFNPTAKLERCACCHPIDLLWINLTGRDCGWLVKPATLGGTQGQTNRPWELHCSGATTYEEAGLEQICTRPRCGREYSLLLRLVEFV